MKKYDIIREARNRDGSYKIVRLRTNDSGPDDMHAAIELYHLFMNQYMDIVRAGDETALMRLFSENSFILIDYMGDMAQDRHIDALFSIAWGMQAAMEGGLDPITAYKMRNEQLSRLGELTGYHEIMTYVGEIMLSYCRASARAKNGDAPEGLVRRVARVISRNAYVKITPTIVANALGMNAEYVSRRYKALTGRTIKQASLEYKILIARRELRDTRKTIDDIATLLAFSSASHFHREFTKRTGATPGEFRKRLLQNKIDKE